MKLVRFINRHIILQVFLASLPFLLAGLVISYNILDKNFDMLGALRSDTWMLLQGDIRDLEQQLYSLQDRNNRYAAEVKSLEAEQQVAAIRDELYKKAYEIRGLAIALASTLTRNTVNELAALPDASAARIKTQLEQVFGEKALEILYWSANQPLDRLIPRQKVSGEFYEYAQEAFDLAEADWFEDRLETRDVVVSLVPFRRDGLFIVFFDLSEAYSYYDRAERAGLSLDAVRQQEQRFLDAKRQQLEFQQQREKQAGLMLEKAVQRNRVFQESQQNLILFTALNLVALIGTAIFLFWHLGTRRIALLSDWLQKTSLAIRRFQENGLHESQQVEEAWFERRFSDDSANELGELSRNINYMLETLQQTTVSRNLLQREINEKEAMAAQLVEHKKRRDLIFSSVQAGVLMVDRETRRIIDLNPAALELFQAAKEAIADRDFDAFFSDLNLIDGAFPASGEAESVVCEALLQPLQGEPVSVLRTDRIAVLDDREILVSSLVNFESVRKSREQLQQAKQAAEQASRMKSEFLANMSHEIRTPLNGVIGMAQLLYESKMTTDQARICQSIQAEADSLLRIINEILDLSKIEAGKMDFELIPFSPRSLVEQVTENLALQVPQKRLNVLCYVPPELPDTVIGDPGRLQQILTNLGNNALKFTQEGQIYLSAEQVMETAEQIVVDFSVADTGIGIAADKQALIFESFTQADGSTTRKYGGSGLGTTISKQLVELMGGEIGLTSEEGRGSTFRFTVPFRKSPQNVQPAAAVDLHGKKILVVDDNPTSRIILDRYLESFGCRVQLCSAAGNSLSCLDDSSDIDLILTDYNMPGLNGRQFVREARTLGHRQVPIVMLSSHHTANYLEEADDLDIQGILRKPVRKDDLYNLLQSVFSLSPESATPRIQPAEQELPTKKRAESLILLVEDYPTNQQIALRYLVNAGYKVDIAENGLQAVAACREQEYALILMDVQMPEMDGYAATAEIRTLEAESGKRTPILAMTAHASTGYREKCLAADMDDYISKPIRKESFLGMVDCWLLGDGPAESQAVLRQEQARYEDSAVFNYPQALQAFLADEEFLGEVIDGYMANLESQLPMIEQAIADCNLTLVWKEAHSIKGGSYNLCANRLAQTAALLEKAGREEDLAECRTCFAALQDDFKNFKQMEHNRQAACQVEVV